MTIRSEIESRLGTWASAQTPKIPVALENVDFTKPITGGYVEVVMLDSAVKNRGVAATGQRITGMFQINVFMPLGSGMGAIDALADTIVDLYPVLPKIGTVSIEQPLSGSSAFIVEDFMCLPLTGRYRVEV